MKRHKIILFAIITCFCGFASQAKPTKAQAFQPAPKITIVKASWYSKQSPGINYRTANNEVFDDKDLTCAIWGVPFNQEIKVTNLSNGKSIIVRVNDRGPHRRFVKQGRGIDLTKKAFAEIGSLKSGLIKVSLEFL